MQSLKRYGNCAVIVGLLVSGCGRNDSESPNADGSAASLPINAIEKHTGGGAKVEKGSPEWCWAQILHLRNQPAPKIKTSRDAEPRDPNVEEITKFQRERNEKIVKFAESIVKQTHSDPLKQEMLFVGVHHLMEARLQLALQIRGEAEQKQQREALYTTAEEILRRDPQSQAASEAGVILVKFAETMARREGTEPWVQEYARQSKLFAKNFPTHDHAVAKLKAAAVSCEAHGLTTVARSCYDQLGKDFAEHPGAQDVQAALRRFSLPGTTLKLAGPTVKGGYASIDDYRGRVTLVAFWSAANGQVQSDIATIKSVYGKHSAAGFDILGVNLDLDDAEIASFNKQHGTSWTNIFFPDAKKRGWNNPLVKFYGLSQVPTYWLVGKDGRVLEAHLQMKALDAAVTKALRGS